MSVFEMTEYAPAQQAEFISMLQRDLRNPLNGVIGMMELLIDTELSPTQREIAMIAWTSALSLCTVVNDMLLRVETETDKASA